MVVRVGAVTIGQSPRDDVVPEIREITGTSVEFVECGALDGLSPKQVKQLAPEAGDYVLVSRMRDGTAVTMAERHVMPLLRECFERLERSDVDLIVMLCTGVFPEFEAEELILRPDRLLEQTVEAIIEKGTLGVLTPLEEQVSQTRIKWEKPELKVAVEHALPYATTDQITAAAQRLARADVDLVVLDCIGYNNAMKKTVRAVTGKPAILPRTLLARTISELIT